MYVLGIDTSTQICSIALYHKEKGIISETSQKIDQNHSHTLLILVDQLLKNSEITPLQIECIAVNSGPGSFTGLRIGMAFAKGLAHANNAHIKSANSLDILASQIPFSTLPILALIDAKNSRVYGALYRYQEGKLERKSEYFVGNLAAVLECYKDLTCIAIGDACESYSDRIKNIIPKIYYIANSLNFLRATALCELTLTYTEDHIETLEPFYLLKTQAELQLEEKEEKKNEKN